MKYLVYIGPGIGDWIIALPMIRRIKLNDPQAMVTTLTRSDKNRFKANVVLFSLQKWVDSIEYYSMKEPLHDLQMLFRLGIKKYDYYFKSNYYDNQYISDWPNRIMRMASKKGVGVRLTNKPKQIYDYEILFDKERSVYDTPLELLKLIGINECEEEKTVNLFDVKKIEAEFNKINIEINKKIITLVPGTAGSPVTADGKNGSKPAKSWPLEYWDKLANKLVEDGYKVVLLGGNTEKTMIDGNSYFISTEITNLCGTTSIIESCAIIHNSSIVVGADTGMMHCAGAMGIPSLTLYGCTSYKNYLPYGKEAYYIASCRECSPCFGSDALLTCNDFMCMKEIDVEQVYEKIKLILLK